jgi:hypothetical protein
MSRHVARHPNTPAAFKIRFALAAALAMLTASEAATAARCRPINGHFTEQAFIEGCQSPVGLCLAGTLSGAVTGTFVTTGTESIPTGDTPATGVVHFTADTVVHARLGKLAGDIAIKNAGVNRIQATGEIIDLQTIVGGTGNFIGASGSIQTFGTFVEGVGRSEYSGTVCLP